MSGNGANYSRKCELNDPINLDIPHVMQDENWDCGIACTKMVLRHLHLDNFETDKFETICKKLGFYHSVWTIDIASIFSKYNIKHLLCTLTLGVDPTYEKEDFYYSNFTSEEKRINKLFEQAASCSICIEKRSVDILEVLKHIEAGHVIIVLVDAAILSHQKIELCDCCNPVEAVSAKTHSYIGHFIVVCGYDRTKELITYRNPSMQGLFQTHFDNFDDARKAYGTDEDILFIYNPINEDDTRETVK